MDAEKRKQLRNEYKSSLATGGIYALECSGNHHRCIKSTVNLAGIRNRYQFSIATKGCPDPAFRDEWTRYGIESFSFTVLEELKQKEDKTNREFADEIRLLLELWTEKEKPGKGSEEQ